MWTPNSTPILVLASLALTTAAFQLSLFMLGLRAFLLGQDYVWECRWQFPIRVIATLSRLRRWREAGQHVGVMAGALGSGMARGGRSLAQRARRGRHGLVLPTNLLSMVGRQAPGGRQPIRSKHYQTVGERMRAAQRLAA